jgi:hypothetical protein
VRISKETLLAEMTHFLPSHANAVRAFRIPPRFAFAFRMYWGMFATLAELDADIAFRRVVIETLSTYGDEETRASLAGLHVRGR